MSKGRLYRSPNGKVMGVCQGLANWLRMDVSLIRLAFIIGLFMTGGVLIIPYIALGIFLPIGDEFGSESVYDRMRGEQRDGRRGRKPNITINDVKDEFDNLKSRVTNVEDAVFNKERDWDERFNKS